MTRQRRIILDMLRADPSHPTADEVYRAVRKRLPRISLATVYRNLDLLDHDGLIERVRFDDGPAHYDGHLGPHHHVRCVMCGKLADVPPEFCRLQPCELDRSTGYELVSCHVEISGVCPRCRQVRLDEAARTENSGGQAPQKQK